MSHKACSVIRTSTKAPGVPLCAKARAVMMTVVAACSWLCLSQVAEARAGLGIIIPTSFTVAFIALVFVLPALTLVTLIVQGVRKTSPNGLKMWNICATIVNLCVALGALSVIRLVGLFFLIPGLVGVLAVPLLLLYKDSAPSQEFSIRFAKYAVIVLLLGCVSTVGYLYLHKVFEQKRVAAIKKHEALLKDTSVALSTRRLSLLQIARLKPHKSDGYHVEGLVWKGVKTKGLVFLHLDAPRSDLRGYVFQGSFHDTNFSHSKAKGADFRGALFQSVNFTGADLEGAKFSKSLFMPNFTKANLRGVDLLHLQLYSAKLSGADLTGATLFKKELNTANVSAAIFRGADLRQADLHGSNAKGADFTNANLSRAGLIDVDLREAKLIKVKLAGADFHLAKLAGAVFRDVSFAHVHFRRARMEGGQYHNIKSIRGAFFSPKLLPFLRKVQAIGFDPAKALCLSADQENYARNFAHKCYQWHARRSTKPRPPHCPATLKGPILGYEEQTLEVEGVCPFHVSSQSGGPSTQAAACPDALAQKRSFLQSIKATRQPSKESIVTSLLAIGAGPGVVKRASPTTEPRALAWKKIDGAWHVLMSTWTSFTGYPTPGKPYTTPPKFDIWVTAAPQFRRRCRKIMATSSCPNLRLKQLLGLSPTKKKTHVATFWVKPADLFRPCRDTAIDDRECGLAFPKGTPPAYTAWFAQQAAWAYPTKTPMRGAPWTQLGYTYDWGSKDTRRVGMSEFVIRRKRRVVVHGLVKTSEFCR